MFTCRDAIIISWLVVYCVFMALQSKLLPCTPSRWSLVLFCVREEDDATTSSRTSLVALGAALGVFDSAFLQLEQLEELSFLSSLLFLFLLEVPLACGATVCE